MRTLDLGESEAVVMAADMAGIDIDTDIRRDYSGRFMYGARCFGIVAGPSTYGEFLIEVAGDDEALAKRLADTVRTDDMGLSTIYYWPELRLYGDDEDE